MGEAKLDDEAYIYPSGFAVMPTITAIVVRSRLPISAVRSASVQPEFPRVSHEKVDSECSYDAPTPDVAARLHLHPCLRLTLSSYPIFVAFWAGMNPRA